MICRNSMKNMISQMSYVVLRKSCTYVFGVKVEPLSGSRLMSRVCLAVLLLLALVEKATSRCVSKAVGHKCDRSFPFLKDCRILIFLG